MAKIIPIPKKDKTHRPISLPPAFSKVMERLVLAKVKWLAQLINPYSLGFRSGVRTIDDIAILIHTAAPITALRREYNSHHRQKTKLQENKSTAQDKKLRGR